MVSYFSAFLYVSSISSFLINSFLSAVISLLIDLSDSFILVKFIRSIPFKSVLFNSLLTSH